MNFSNSTYYTKVFRDFREIEVGDFRAVVHFYEEYEEDIRELDFAEYFEVLVTFVDALFQIGKYQKHLLMVDVVIEASVMNNIKIYQGIDIFQKLLFQKAASCFHTFDLEKADHILRELIKMNPNDQDSALFLKKCLRRKKSVFVNSTRAISIFLFLASAIVICMEVIFVRPLFESATEDVGLVRNFLFFSGVVILIGGDLIHRWRVNREVNQFVHVFKRIKGVS